MFAQCCFLIISHFGRLPNFLLLFFFEEFWTISFLWDLFGARPNVKIFLERNYSPPPIWAMAQKRFLILLKMTHEENYN